MRPWERGCHPKLTRNSSKQIGDYMREITYMASIMLKYFASHSTFSSFCLSLTELSRQMSANAVKMEEAERETERLQEQIRKALIRDAKHKW